MPVCTSAITVVRMVVARRSLGAGSYETQRLGIADETTFNAHVLPQLGDRKINELTPSDPAPRLGNRTSPPALRRQSEKRRVPGGWRQMTLMHTAPAGLPLMAC